MNLNWQHEGDYDYIDDLSLPQVAFEFLRRNPRYLKDYERYSEIENILSEKHGKKDSAYNEWLRDWGCGSIFSPPKIENETDEEWLKRTTLAGLDPIRSWYEEWYRNKWGILSVGLPDPTEPLNEPLLFDLTLSFPLSPNYEELGEFFYGDADEDGSYEPWSQLPGFGVIVFDLESPLSSQLKTAKTLLSTKQAADEKQGTIKVLSTHPTSNYKAPFKRYLRILDADAVYESNLNIGKTLFGDDSKQPDVFFNHKKVYETRKRAQLFRDLKYRAIPSWKPTSG